MPTSMPRLLRTLPSSLPTPSAASSPALRRFTTSSRALAVSTANRPKRTETPYGIPASVAKKDRPVEAETDTSNHPLWRFFHEKMSLEVPDKRTDNGSRSWSAVELRRKDFTSLHQLWYVLLRERNVLLTQREEARRLRLDLRGFTSQPEKLRMVQKSMARIKQVLSERRHAALEAGEILRARGEDEAAARMEAEGKQFGDALDGDVGEEEVEVDGGRR